MSALKLKSVVIDGKRVCQIDDPRFAPQPTRKVNFKWLVLRSVLRMFNIKAVQFSLAEGVTIEVEKEVVSILRRRQFVETIEGWSKGFVRIVLTKNAIHIGHSIKGNKLTVVSNPLLTLNDFINYFERI